MLITIEGQFSGGQVELLEQPVGVTKARVIVTFLTGEQPDAVPDGHLKYGKYSGSSMSTDEAFADAEWRDQDD